MLADAIRAELPTLRAEAEALMLDRCTIRRRATGATLDDETGDYEAGSTTVVYSGRCLVSAAGSDVDRDVASLSETVGRRLLKLPRVSPVIQVGDVATIDTSQNPLLVGQRVTVRAVPDVSVQVQRRLVVEDSEIAEIPG